LCNGDVDDFSLPGYDVEELVGFGGSGEVWRARDSSTGELVALKRLRGDAATALSAQQLQREAALLATVRHDHIVALRSVVQTSDGLVLVLDYAEGGSLAAVLGVRGRLSAGEVVTVGAPLAAALADIHQRGLTHGDVSPGNIVFELSGKPLLADLGVASLIGDAAVPVGRTPGYADPAGSAGPATDVHGLAAVCFSALAGSAPYVEARPTVARSLGPLAPDAPVALVAAIEAGLDPDPSARPDAAAFGRALFAACPAAAVQLSRASQLAGATIAPATVVTAGSLRVTEVAPQSPPSPTSRFRRVGGVGRHRWTANRRVIAGRALAAACVVAMLGAAVAIGIVWGWAGSGSQGHRALASDASTAAPPSPASTAAPPSPASTPAPPRPASTPAPLVASPGSPDWSSVVGALDHTRDVAFADADANELDAVYVPGSLALATDRATLGRLVGAGQRVQGLQFSLQSVRVVSQTATAVTLTVVDTLAAYDVVDAGGATTRFPGRGVRTWTVALRAQPAGAEGWQIASVTPA
jgi:serine/threonine protein kinase